MIGILVGNSEKGNLIFIENLIVKIYLNYDLNFDLDVKVKDNFKNYIKVLTIKHLLDLIGKKIQDDPNKTVDNVNFNVKELITILVFVANKNKVVNNSANIENRNSVGGN